MKRRAVNHSINEQAEQFHVTIAEKEEQSKKVRLISISISVSVLTYRRLCLDTYLILAMPMLICSAM